LNLNGAGSSRQQALLQSVLVAAIVLFLAVPKKSYASDGLGVTKTRLVVEQPGRTFLA
tara:strand:- start:231 stop:404 length:174 start_codon:yes stop_codon:yes gene_type:complete